MELNASWIVIADDFTGAADASVQFATAAKPARLVLDWHDKRTLGNSIAALVVDTDSRFLSAHAAYQRVYDATKALSSARAMRFYKKIDSTLRGNPADEIAAVLEAGRFQFAVVTPSMPKNGRTVREGVCYVRGVPLASSFAAHDPFTPVTTSRVSKIFERRFGSQIRELPLSVVRAGRSTLEREVRTSLADGAKLFIADAESLEDLEAVASLASIEGGLFAGSAGLAEALAVKKLASEVAEAPPTMQFSPSEMLFVIGSITGMSAAQSEKLVAAGVAEIVVDCDALLRDADAEQRRLSSLLEKQPSDLPLLIRTTAPKGDLSGASPLSASGDAADARIKAYGATISRAVGSFTAHAVRMRKPRFLFASGGDTAARIAGALGAASIDFTDEILPGMPFGTFFSDSTQQRLHFVSKAGDFGTCDSLVTILAKLSSGR